MYTSTIRTADRLIWTNRPECSPGGFSHAWRSELQEEHFTRDQREGLSSGVRGSVVRVCLCAATNYVL